MSRLIVASLGDEPPTEFRLFKAGPNKINGKVFLFDQEAANSLMATYEDRGTDVMIDLEHYALKPEALARADAPDARGWAQLQLRAGELWAVNVKWTPDGERRIREKTQRYVSPAFRTNEAGQIVELVNVAMVAMPGTHSAPALVAATADNRFTEPVSVRAKRYIDNVRQQKHANR